MSDRAEFEKWYDKTTNRNYGVAYYADITGRYCHHDIEIAWKAWQAARVQPEPSSEELRARVTELGVRYSDLKALADEMSDAADREAFELCYAEKISGIQSVLRACRSGDCYVVSEGDRLNIAWEVWQALAEKALGLLSKTASQAEQEGE